MSWRQRSHYWYSSRCASGTSPPCARSWKDSPPATPLRPAGWSSSPREAHWHAARPRSPAANREYGGSSASALLFGEVVRLHFERTSDHRLRLVVAFFIMRARSGASGRPQPEAILCISRENRPESGDDAAGDIQGVAETDISSISAIAWRCRGEREYNWQ